MPVPTDIKFKDYIKAVQLLAVRHFDGHNIINKSGSARRFELFKNGKIVEMWVIHESKYVYTKDFKQTLGHLGVSENEFRSCC